MDTIFSEFGESHSAQNGYRLSKTLSPELSNDMLRVVRKSCNHHDVKNVLKRGIQNSGSGFEEATRRPSPGWSRSASPTGKQLANCLLSKSNRMPTVK